MKTHSQNKKTSHKQEANYRYDETETKRRKRGKKMENNGWKSQKLIETRSRKERKR